MTPEGAVKALIKERLDKIDAWYFMPSMTGFGRRGIPDFVGHWRGVFFAIEAKAPGGVPTAWQARELYSIRDRGGVWAVVSDEASLDAILSEIQRLCVRERC